MSDLFSNQTHGEPEPAAPALSFRDAMEELEGILERIEGRYRIRTGAVAASPVTP